MKIGPQDNGASLRRRWGVPLSVATGVTALSVAAVVVLGGTEDAGPSAADPAHSGGSPVKPTPAPSPSASHGATSGGDGSVPSSRRGTSPEAAFAITDATTTPIDAGTVTKILSACLGPEASQYHAVIAVRTPVASRDWDGVVVAVNSADQYVQCQSKGDKGTSQDSPPTFINDRLWGTGRVVEYFDSMLEPVGTGKYLMLGAGHYTSDVSKITISYGDDPKEYPARMAGGAFVYGAALSPDTPPGPRYMGPSPYVHAYDAAGKEIYNQAKDPKFTGKQ
ncbi:hypothetical protein OG302_41215 [Streptomyces sp. NBC_01283]|uniref:hypothetical protein n=1 Tax=Streptomyces sp. NBC_01283 TaxID=2903812 RepID=UPI00352DFFAB|nr:hypothetical protein OG302_41215 [Streptomyces sp. NBC_01283]